MAARDREQIDANGRHRAFRPNGEFIGIAEAVRTGARYRIANAARASKDDPSSASKWVHKVLAGSGVFRVSSSVHGRFRVEADETQARKPGGKRHTRSIPEIIDCLNHLSRRKALKTAELLQPQPRIL
jgi:hypothetical protein